MKTKPISKCLTRMLGVLAATVLCGTARADLSISNSLTTASWNTENGQAPFYTSVSAPSGAGTGQGLPTLTGTTAVLSEIISITNGAGGLTATTGATNYLLTGLGMPLSTSGVTMKVHLFDITANLTGGVTGAGATYNFTANGDLLGHGAGLPYVNALGAENQVSLYLSTGTNTDDQVVLGSNHIYAVEIEAPSGLQWFRTGSGTDAGGQAMASANGALTSNRVTIAALGLGGQPRNFGLALYGTPTSAAPTVNTSLIQAGVTNFIVDDFMPNGVSSANVTNYDYYNSSTNTYTGGFITNVWGNWFGDGSTVCVWDSTKDAQNNPNSGSLYISWVANGGNQLEVWEEGSGNSFYAMDVNNLVFSNFECDVLYSNGSAVVTNGGTTNYGALQFGTRATTYAQDYFSGGPTGGVIRVPQGTTNWTHVIIPLNPLGNAIEAQCQNVLIHDYAPFGGDNLTGASAFWVDNIKFTGTAAPVVIPPPTLAIQPAIPGLRIFAGSLANTYDREELATLNSNQSWQGGGTTYPVKYQFTLLSTANFGGFQTHIFLVPVAQANNTFQNNEYIETQASNDLWLQINGQANGGYIYNLSWKTNSPNANPFPVFTNTITIITTNTMTMTTNTNVFTGPSGAVAIGPITNNTPGSEIGTWTLQFNNASSGTLTAPGVAPKAFTITDPNIGTDFANPLVAFFGLQANSVPGGGAFEDYQNITVSGPVGGNINDTFANDTAIDTVGTWNITDSALQTSLVIVPTGSPFWVTWTLPATGYVLTETADLTGAGSPNAPNPFVLPGYYSAETATGSGTPANTQPAVQNREGKLEWTLMNTNFMPTVGYTQFANPAPLGFFQLQNPAPSN